VTPAPNVGIFGDQEAALAGVVARLAAALDPREIWLFGSRADGRARADSDFDLLVVAKARGRFGSTDHVRARAPLRDLGVACDVVPCSAEDFEEERNYPHSFVGQIVEQGRRVYESAPG
jgi:predicted nucleotidyltransferase